MTKLIDELIPKVMHDVGDIAKARKNQQQNYNFRGVDDVLNAVSPALAKHGVSQSVEVIEYKDDRHVTCDPMGYEGGPSKCYGDKLKFAWVSFATIKLRVSLIAADGSSRSFEAIGSACDHGGDKAMNKAHSAAYKYAMILGLAIPVEARDMDDSDDDAKLGVEPHDDRGHRQNGQQPANRGGSQPQQPKEPPKPAEPPPSTAYDRAFAAIRNAKTDDELIRLKGFIAQRVGEGVLTQAQADVLNTLADGFIVSMRAASQEPIAA